MAHGVKRSHGEEEEEEEEKLDNDDGAAALEQQRECVPSCGERYCDAIADGVEADPESSGDIQRERRHGGRRARCGGGGGSGWSLVHGQVHGGRW